MLGSLIADVFSAEKNISNIYYIHAKGAVIPTSEKVVPIEIETVNDLLSAIRDLFQNHTVDAIIHAMAVSDYRVKSVNDVEDVFNIAKNISKADNFIASVSEKDIRKDNQKISSELNNPLLLLERTPKILPMFRKMAPNATVVGFKLLSGVSAEKLIDTGYRLLLKSECDYVFANDYSTISAQDHRGYLINSGRFVIPYSGKENIARGIVTAVLGKEST